MYNRFISEAEVYHPDVDVLGALRLTTTGSVLPETIYQNFCPSCPINRALKPDGICYGKPYGYPPTIRVDITSESIETVTTLQSKGAKCLEGLV